MLKGGAAAGLGLTHGHTEGGAGEAEGGRRAEDCRAELLQLRALQQTRRVHRGDRERTERPPDVQGTGNINFLI